MLLTSLKVEALYIKQILLQNLLEDKSKLAKSTFIIPLPKAS